MGRSYQDLKVLFASSPSPVARDVSNSFLDTLAMNPRLAGSVLTEAAGRLFQPGLTSAQQEEARAMVEHGISLRFVARQFGTSRESIRGVMKRLGRASKQKKSDIAFIGDTLYRLGGTDGHEHRYKSNFCDKHPYSVAISFHQCICSVILPLLPGFCSFCCFDHLCLSCCPAFSAITSSAALLEHAHQRLTQSNRAW